MQHNQELYTAVGKKSVPNKAARVDRVRISESDESIRYALLRGLTASQAVRELDQEIG